MELRDLRAFAAVLELGGMTRAARRLHVVQSAVSQAIKRLEQEYGLQLLERRSDGVIPTAAGEELGRYARRILDLVERLDADMASFRGHARGVVNVGVVSTLEPILVARLVNAIDRALPDVTLHIKEGVAAELLEALRLTRLDLVALVLPVTTEELPTVTTGELELRVIVPPRHRFADRETIRLNEVSDEAWISFAPSNPGRRWLDDNGRRAGFRPIVSSEIETLTQLKAFVEAGHGIGLLPLETVELEVRAGRLRAVRAVDPTPVALHGYTYDPQRTSSATGHVRSVLEACMRSLSTVETLAPVTPIASTRARSRK